MFRTALTYLEQWVGSESRKPLVIRGARQVGKTWLVRKFAQSRNLNLIEINFELDPDKKSLFVDNNPKKLLLTLETSLGKKIDIDNTLLFLDEVQAFPLILAKLRWFKELMPNLAVVVAGSLLEFVLDDHDFSMPVGRISYLHLEPLSFDEFLYSRNKQMLEFLQGYNWEEIPDTLHKQALSYLQEYIVVGGLPAAVDCWLKTESLLSVHQMQHDLLTTYRDDFARYKGKYNSQFFDDIFNYIPQNVGNKVVYSHINQGSQSSSIKQVFSLIVKSRVIHEIQASAGNGTPLAAEVNSRYSKAIVLDVGLMNNILGINLHDFKSINDIDFINRGAIAEQVVGQLLRTIDPYYVEPKLYYWQRNHSSSNAEIDYLIQHNTTIIPIEVKSGSYGSMQSLHFFMKLKNLSTAVRLNTNMPCNTNIQTKISNGEIVRYKLLSLPIYMLGQLRRLLVTN